MRPYRVPICPGPIRNGRANWAASRGSSPNERTVPNGAERELAQPTKGGAVSICKRALIPEIPGALAAISAMVTERTSLRAGAHRAAERDDEWSFARGGPRRLTGGVLLSGSDGEISRTPWRFGPTHWRMRELACAMERQRNVRTAARCARGRTQGEAMVDRLPDIKRELAQIYAVGGSAASSAGPYPLGQIDWLVGEIERLREAIQRHRAAIENGLDALSAGDGWEEVMKVYDRANDRLWATIAAEEDAST